jgi:hypothetical protein
MRKLFLALALLVAFITQAQIDSITQRIFLVGDAGELVGNTHPVIDWLGKNVDWNDEKNTALFLGDNIYPLGLPMKGEADYERSKAVMDYLLKPFMNKKSKAFFIPGNHDWKNGKLGGWQQVRNQHEYINGKGQPNIKSLPEGGCPGPDATNISNQVAVIFIDSQWFLYVHDKPGPGSDCTSRTVEEFQTELRNLLAAHDKQLVILVTHHPMYSHGVHGGDIRLKEIIFPFTALNKNLWIPVPPLGLIYYLSRSVFGNLQDVNHPYYREMVNSIEDEIKDHPNIIVAAGHDHTLQFILKDSIHYIVSGSASNLSQAQQQKSRPGKLLYLDENFGFSMIEIKKSGNISTKFYNVNAKNLESPDSVFAMKPIYAVPDVVSKDTIPVFPDSVLVAANTKLKSTGLRNLFIGKNYRKEWTTPVKVPVLDFGKEFGGITPEKEGGGKQTRSLRVKNKAGREWALRSVEKYPEAAIPPDLRQTFVKDIVADGISASYPFGGLSVETFAKAAGVPTLRKKLVFIPDDPRLGRFRETFKNTLATLEERQPEDVDEDDNTDKVVLKLAKDNDDHIDQRAVLKARLLDNYYMDLDRHEGQWSWTTRDTGKGKIYVPIPKDQDQAFFTNQGIIPYFVKKPWVAPELQGFDDKADNIKTFNKPARNFDRFFLNELSKETWSNYIDSFLTKMTDKVIEDALMRQPKEVRGFHYDEIVKTLKQKRAHFKNDMMEYYGFLSKEVTIVGSNQRELFTIDKLPENKMRVTVHKIDKNNVISSKIYDRLFDKDETKEVLLYGLEDRDSFVVRGGDGNIKVRIIGGPGDDHFNNESKEGKRIRVYDVTGFENNSFSGNEGGFIKRLSTDPRVNEYNRLSYKYGYFNPSIRYAYSVDDGLFLGVRGIIVTHGFRKEPFSTQHTFGAAKALRTSSYFFGYEGQFIKAIMGKDLLVRADLRAPTNVSNFFGIGNNTEIDPNAPGGINFYRARYDISNLSVLLRSQLQSWMRVSYGLAFQHFHVEQEENKDKFLGNAPLFGVDQTTLYNRKMFLGGQLLLDINSKNSEQLPTRGFKLDAGVRSFFGLNDKSNRVTQLHWDMSVFISTNPRPRFVYAERLGVGHNIGAYDIPQAQYLSGTENLRGYRRNRFAGETMLFNNFEVRMRLFDFSTFLFPGALGLLGFHDIGRVWADEEKSGRWHMGYGGGIWIAPIRRWVAAVSVAHSKDENLIAYLSLGFRF